MAKTAAQLLAEIKPYLIRLPGKAARAIEANSSLYPRGRTEPAKHWSASSGTVAVAPGSTFTTSHLDARAPKPSKTKRAPAPAPIAASSGNLHEDFERFLAVIPPDRVARTRLALDVLADGARNGEIYNAELNNAKSAIDYSFEIGWKQFQSDYDTYWMPDKKTPTARGLLMDELGYVQGVRGSIAAAKRLAKTKHTGDAGHLAKVRAYIAASLPIALLIESLKSKVIKGKKPDPKVAERRAVQAASEVRMTCPCCFRPINVLPNGRMADHGYELKVHWGKTGSCYGRDFRPLEISKDGLEYIAKLSARHLTEVEKELAAAPSKTTITVGNNIDPKKNKIVTRPDQLGGSPAYEWEGAYRSLIARLEMSRDGITRQLKDYRAKLATWKPTATDAEARGKSRKRSKAELDREIKAALK
jgi:hypothetical protein